MVEAAAYLIQRSAANRVRHLVRKVKSPRYLIALILGIGYLVLVFFGQRAQHASPTLAPIAITATVVILLLVAKWWLFGTDRTALAFTAAEIQFLFPAPVSRRSLLGFKLLRAQLPILINVVIWVVILHRGRESPLPTVVYAVSLWCVFMLLMLHRLGVALTRDAVLDHGIAGIRRHWLTIGVGLLLIVIFGNTALSLMQMRELAPDASVLTQLSDVFAEAPVRYLIAPFRLPFQMLEAADLATWATRFLIVLGMIALHVLWVFRADHAFEEAAIAASVKRAELLDRWKRQGLGGAPISGSQRRSLGLARSGHPIGAIIWKNLTRLLRTSSGTALALMIVLMLGVIGFSLLQGDAYPEAMDLISSLSVAWALVLSLLGPQWIRNDLRTDLEHLDQLRIWPMSGGAIVTAEVLSSGIALTIMQSCLILVGVTALVQHNLSTIPVIQMVVFTPFVLLFLGGVNLLALSFQNGAAILYPAWVKTEIRPGGIEAMGQHLLTAGASILLLAVALLGPVGVGGALSYYLYPKLSNWGVLPGIVLSLAGIILELGLLIEWLGGRLERLDPTLDR